MKEKSSLIVVHQFPLGTMEQAQYASKENRHPRVKRTRGAREETLPLVATLFNALFSLRTVEDYSKSNEFPFPTYPTSISNFPNPASPI